MARVGKTDKGRLYSPSVLRRQSNTRRDKIAWVLNHRNDAQIAGPPGPPGLNGGWTLAVNESGASLANWTHQSGAGTVVVSAGTFLFTNSGTGFDYEEWGHLLGVPNSALVFQADVNMHGGGGHTGGSDMGLVIDTDNNNGSSGAWGMYAALRTAGQSPTSDGLIYTELPSTQRGGPTTTFRFSFNTFYTLRVVAIGHKVDIFVNGTWVNQVFRIPYNSGATSLPACTSFGFGLRQTNTIGQFKNIKLWNMVLP